MKKSLKYTLTYILLCFTASLSAQSNKILYQYKGTSGIGSVNISDKVVLTFDRAITGRYYWTGTGFTNTSIKSDAILNNSLSNVNRVVNNKPNITFSVSEIAVDDYYLNNVLFDVTAGYNQNNISFSIDYNGMSTSVNLNDGLSSVTGSFPINKSTLPFTVYKYLNASPLVQSTNTDIANSAKSITAWSTDLRTVILKLCTWIEANILMEESNPSNVSLNVYNNKVADCDGAAHLLAAFCRSLDIPARIVSGYYIQNMYTIPISKTSTKTWGSGNGTSVGGHAACEIYIPSTNKWVRCDPAQRTVLFGSQNFIKMATGSESTNHLQYGYGPYTYSWTQAIAPLITGLTLTPAVNISSPSASYSFVKSEQFAGTLKTAGNGYLFCAADPTISVGFYDKVTINDPTQGTTMYGIGQLPNNTYTMTPCTPANFYAKFISETVPETYANTFDWTLILYRSNGEEYIYAQQNGIWPNAYNPNEIGSGCYWQPTLGVLPAYDWLYDPSGGIYGKIKVKVNISDGDTKTDETTIGMSPVNNIQNVTYNTNTTINTCAELKLSDVSISGSPIITINSNGLGTTINGSFEVPLGATLIVNP